MKKAAKWTLISLILAAAILLLIAYITKHDIAVLEPAGLIGKRERDLIWICTLLMLIVVVPVLIMTLVFALKYREDRKNDYKPDWGHSTLAEAVWWGVPCLIIVVLSVLTYKGSFALNPFKPLASEKEPVRIQVVALQWKWLFLYPDHGVATVNFIQVPKGRPINFEITGDSPMNSFWIPKLGGQIYAMPAMRTKIHLIADKEGDFTGRSAHLSGKGFAGMIFTVRSGSEEAFEEWLSCASGEVLDWERYKTLVKPSSYVPKTIYTLDDCGLFEQIVKQYQK